MKIDLGYGAYLEPDNDPRDTPWHRKIVTATPLPNTKTGNRIVLECNHTAMSFGRLELAGGRVLCTQCRDEAEAKRGA